MLELLIALLLSLGINFGKTDDGKISVSSADYTTVKAASINDDGISTVSLDGIIINDGVDPLSNH